MASIIRIRIVKWLLDGRRVRPNTPGAKKVVTRSRKWYGIGIPGYPRKKRVPLCENKPAALMMLAEKCRRGEMGLADVLDKTAEHQSNPIAGHLDDFRRWLRAANRTAEHVSLVTRRVEVVCSDCRFLSLSDLNANRFVRWIADAKSRTKRPISIQTANHYIQAISQFGIWLESQNRIVANPFKNIPKGNPETDLKIRRRAFTQDEFARLLQAARTSPKSLYHLTGTDRYFLYRVAYYTAFRADALASLTPESFDLDATPPSVTLAITRNKSRKAKTNALPMALVADLRAYLQTKVPRQPIWGIGVAMQQASKIVAADMKAAGIPKHTLGPNGKEQLDFHAIRHTSATELTRGDLRTAQEILGHSTPTLTARYAHRNLEDQASAVEQMG